MAERDNKQRAISISQIITQPTPGKARYRNSQRARWTAHRQGSSFTQPVHLHADALTHTHAHTLIYDYKLSERHIFTILKCAYSSRWRVWKLHGRVWTCMKGDGQRKDYNPPGLWKPFKLHWISSKLHGSWAVNKVTSVCSKKMTFWRYKACFRNQWNGVVHTNTCVSRATPP